MINDLTSNELKNVLDAHTLHQDKYGTWFCGMCFTENTCPTRRVVEALSEAERKLFKAGQEIVNQSFYIKRLETALLQVQELAKNGIEKESS